VAPFVSCTKKAAESPSAGNKVVNLAIWSNFISQEALEDFKAKTGITVNVTNYSSNEELLAKLQAGATGFDVAVPSDYMVFAMAQLGLLEKIDPAKTPNRAGLDPLYLNKAFDPSNEHSLPFDWGTTGIAVHRDRFKGEIKSWKQLFETPELAGKFTLLDDAREVLGAALKSMGKSLNTTSASDIEQAKALLKKIKPRVKSFTSEPLVGLKEGEIAVAQAFSSDALQARRDTQGKIDYIIPEEGATLWIDCLVIPKGAPHVEEAHALVNYLLDSKTDLERVKKILVGSAHRGSAEALSAEVRAIPGLFPSESIRSKLEVMNDLGDAIGLYDRAWTEVKAGE
jgi:spermidine/putrescine transport system substrate-binding protein